MIARPLQALGAAAAIALAGLAVPAQATYTNTPTQTWGVNGTVFAMVSRGNVTYLGGNFTELRNPATGAHRPAMNLAAINRTTGWPLRGYSASANEVVHSLALSRRSTMLYVGGAFTKVDGTKVRHLAAISPTTGARIKAFTASTSDVVRSLLVRGDKLYVGGQFSYVNHRHHYRLAKLRASSGRVVSSWNPHVHGGDVFALAYSTRARGLVVGGNFAALNAASRRDLGSVNETTGRTTRWKPKPRCPKKCPVFDLDTSGVSVFAAVGGPGGTLAAYNSSTGATRWFDHADGDVQAVDYSPSDHRVYVGGHFDPGFTSVRGTVVRHQLAAVKPGNGATDSRFAPPVKPRIPGVWALIANRGILLTGGGFTEIGGKPQPGYAEFPVR